MKIRRSTRTEEALWSRLAKFMNGNRRDYKAGEFHVSDILDVRQAYFKITDPKPPKRESLAFFTAGRAHHEIIQEVLPGKPEFQVKVKKKGITITATIDSMVHYPIEVKTSRKWKIPDQPESHYTEQLLYYMAQTGKTCGKIIVFYICPGRTFDGKTQTTPDFRAWDVHVSAPELGNIRKEMHQRAAALHTAVTAGTLNKDSRAFEKLPLCAAFKCGGKGRGGTYVSCQWYEACKPEGRYPEERLG